MYALTLITGYVKLKIVPMYELLTVVFIDKMTTFSIAM